MVGQNSNNPFFSFFFTFPKFSPINANQVRWLIDVGENEMFHLVLLGVLSLLLYKLANKFLNSGNYFLPANAPPGSSGFPLIGETLQFMAAINSGEGFYNFVRARHLRYGNCFRTNIFGETHVFVSSAESAKAILNNESGNFTKKYIKSIAKLVGDQSLLCASSHHHKLLRNHLLPLFSTTSVSLFVQQFDELIMTSIENWGKKGSVIVLDQALQITFKAMCKTLMSLEDSKQLEILQEDVACVCDAMLSFPLQLPWTRFSKGLKARKRIMNTLEKMIIERRRFQEDNNDDFLQKLLTDQNGSSSVQASRLSDQEIKDNILTMIIAGQDTSASAITWMVKYLGENQNVLDELRTEQFHLAEKLSLNQCLTLEDLNEMSYASKVVKESLRKASIVAWLPRLALQDTEIEGFKILNGWNINTDARSIHLDPMLRCDPDKFNPSRFDDDQKPYSFLAFGMGARACLGMNMAKAMMLIFLHRLVTTYEWKVTDSDPSIVKWALFSRLKSGCPIDVTPIRKDS
ncbi:hypothetical protein K2173_027875 [Erythroxylum novogranatense]|uniref:Cytochrome P450 n=1 Tax=Erythroxylum novogranatense TaxID=1862640 RepID=A0AAV8U467_9ROSI|nr:hypothetical protein K2173_027875 [Erythroxylum novogranatense]